MLHFSVKRMLGAVTDLYGTLLPKSDGLQILYKDTDSELDPLDVEVTSLTIPWADIRSVDVESGMMSTKVKVVLAKPVEVPFVRDGLILLTIRSKDQDLIQPFLREVRERRAGKQDSDTDDFIEDMRDFLWDL